MDKAKEAGEEMLDKAKEAGTTVMDKAKEAAGSVSDMTGQAMTAVGRKADDLTAAAGHKIEAAGEAVARKLPHEGLTGHASQAVADTMKEAGKYLEEAKLSGLAHDVAQVVKTHPIPTMLICFGIGFCVGRMLKD
jgi:hypothetical protein